MSIKQFIQKENINMLWDVISDEDIFKFLSRDIQAKIYQLFVNNIQGFFDTEKVKPNSLVDINKKYILLILNHIKNTYPYQPSKITIHTEPTKELKELITFEEIQNDRKSQFERDLSKKQEEFEDFMSIKAPPVPEFSDKDKDSPIKEMDKILKEMQTQRNYEIQQINKNYSTNNNSQVDNWLKPQETSLKNQKLLKPSNDNLLVKDKKNVSFNDIEEINTFNTEDEEDNNIFSKLKKVSDKQNENITLQIHEQGVFEEDRITKLEREVRDINKKMDKILELLNRS
jgi:hypothetical protein